MESASGHGPAVERALLTTELRRLRQAAGKRQQDAAEAFEWSTAKIIRIERGTSPVTKTDLAALLHFYGVTDEAYVNELTARAAAARQKGWWEDFEQPGDKAFVTYIGYESGASTIRVSEALVIPGQLQTPEYTKGVLESFQIPQEVIQRVIRFRTARQHHLAERKPEQTYIIDESILRRPAGRALPAQLRHLIAAARNPEITIQVIPLEQGYHFGLRGPFSLLGFDVPLNDVLYVENTLQGDLFITEMEEQISRSAAPTIPDPAGTLAAHINGFRHLREIALGPDQSLKLIEDIADTLS